MKYRILIVEDDDSIRDLFGQFLKEDFDVLLAVDGEDGLSAYKTLKPDVVLMDLVMPKVSGLQAAKNILEFDPTAKIIMLTVHGNEEVRETAMTLGVADYKTKPINHEGLVAAVEHVLNIKKVEQGV